MTSLGRLDPLIKERPVNNRYSDPIGFNLASIVAKKMTSKQSLGPKGTQEHLHHAVVAYQSDAGLLSLLARPF